MGGGAGICGLWNYGWVVGGELGGVSVVGGGIWIGNRGKFVGFEEEVDGPSLGV
jgi:hypothetical protein